MQHRAALALAALPLLLACGGAATTPAGGGGTTSATHVTTIGSGGNTGGASSTGGTSSTGSTNDTSTTTTSTSTTSSGPPVDACTGVSAACPGAPPSSAGQGLRAVDRCAFPLVDQNTWAAKTAAADALATVLPRASLADVLGDLNRTAVTITAAQLPGSATGFARGFRWNDGDESVAYWIPQGLSGSRDASATGTVSGREILLVSWYYDIASDAGSTLEKGVRIAFVDASASPPTYRFALLVDPTAGATPSFGAVNIHAGGIAWIGDYLYVADTSKGFRVFDLTRMLRVDTTKDVIGWDAATSKHYAAQYRYVIPQVGRYLHASSCSPLFSFVALDRSTTPPSLVSGEYCSTTACSGALAGRLFHWPLDPATSRLGAGTIWPSEASYMGEKQVQGGVTHAGTTYLSSSAPAGGAGALYVIPQGGKTKTVGWVDAPEDMLFDTTQDRLWSLSEAAGARYVFAVKAP